MTVLNGLELQSWFLTSSLLSKGINTRDFTHLNRTCLQAVPAGYAVVDLPLWTCLRTLHNRSANE